MHYILNLALSVVALLAYGLPALAQGMERGPEPGWVEEVAIPPVDPALRAEAVDGVFYTLSDHQIRWVGDEKLDYGRTVLEVTDRAGLEEAAGLSLDFDPAFDRLMLVRLVRIRGGVATDLRDTLESEVYRRETQLEEGVIDGTLTAVLQIPDLRVGDVVDYATIVATRPVVPGGQRSGYSTLEWGVPVGLSRTVLYWPEAWPLTLGALPDRVVHRMDPAQGGIIRHEWRREGNIPSRGEADVPVEDDPTAILRFSDQADWSALSAALTPYYAADYPLTPEWEEKLAAIMVAETAEEGRAIAALRLVQDEIRYVSLSVGAGGYFARLPAEVIRTGFGDCKDKALLVRVLLSRMGIASEVALTDLDAGHALPLELPTLGAFDHMILRIRSSGQVVWVDPTATHQGGGFATAAPSDYGFALPLTGRGQRMLERISVTPEASWSQDVTERYLFTPLGVILDVTTEYRGGSADASRLRWATTPASQLSAEYLEYYQKRYPGLTARQTAAITDDRRGNLVTMQEQYFLRVGALDENGLWEDFVFASNNFTSNLPEASGRPRQLPLYVGSPAVMTHRVEVRGAPIAFEAPQAVQLSNPAFEFSLTGEVGPAGAMVLVWAFRTEARVVPADAVAGVLEDALTVSDATWLSWDLTETE